MYRDPVSNEVGREKGRRGPACLALVHPTVVARPGIAYLLGLLWGLQNSRPLALGPLVLDSSGGSHVWLAKVRGTELDGRHLACWFRS